MLDPHVNLRMRNGNSACKFRVLHLVLLLNAEFLTFRYLVAFPQTSVHLFQTPGVRNHSCQCAIKEAVALGTADSEYVHKVCLFAVRNHCSSVSDTPT